MPPQSPDQQKAIVQRMIDAGESEENIATVIQHFKTIPPPPQEPKRGAFAKIGDAVDLAGGIVRSGLESVLGETGADLAIRTSKAAIGSHAPDLLIGAGKGAASTALGLTELANKTGLLGPRNSIPEEAFGAVRERYTTPTNAVQSMGKTGEQIAEFFLPAGEATKASSFLIQKGPKALQWLTKPVVRAGVEGATAATVHAAQTGGVEGARQVGTIGAVTGAAAPMVGKAISWLGNRVENALVKAYSADVKDGFKVGNIFKYNLGGRVEQTLEKSETKLKDFGTQMRAELSRPNVSGSAPMVDVLGAVSAAEKELLAKSARHTGQNEAIQRAFQSIRDDIAAQSKNSLFPGTVDLVTANEIKQGIGELGAWQFGVRDADAAAKEIVANTIYSQLRKTIEGAVVNPGKLKELNKAMGEIIPIRQAIIRRIPVNQRSNVINLGDMIGWGSGSWVLPLANRVLRSGEFANVASKTGEALATKGGTGLFGGGVASQVIR